MEKNYIKFAHISDIHINNEPNEVFRGMKPYDNYLQVMDHISKHPYDFIIASGDISEQVTCESYLLIKEILSSLFIPVYFIPGNHDNLPNFCSVLGNYFIAYDKPIRFKDWEFYSLDTIVTAKNHGHIHPENLTALSNAIKCSSAENIGLIMHHQPFKVGTPLIDKLGIDNAAILPELFTEEKRIKLVLFGHVHNDYQSKLGHAICSSAPATCFQFTKGSTSLDIDYKFGYKEYILNNNLININTIWLN